MRRMRWATWVAALALAALTSARPAVGDVTSDQAAAILQYPFVYVEDSHAVTEGFDLYTDTVIQISNVSDAAVDVHCFWENANAHCTNTGDVCFFADECCTESSLGCGVCFPSWNETDFRFRLTPRQPLAWLAGEGLTQFPLTGIGHSVGPDGSSNAGSRIPAVPEDPFIGLLKCVAVDPETGSPVDRNVLKGEATLEFVEDVDSMDAPSAAGFIPPIDVAEYNAVGILAHPGANNGDNVLDLGPDGEGEYNGCPNVWILNHFFDLVVDPVNQTIHQTGLVIVPCTEDILHQIPGAAVVQYLVYNEFEQRFSTSRPFDCQQALPISLIDTTDETRSIFSAGVAGTVTGQTRFTSVAGSGLLAVAIEGDVADGSALTAAFNVHFQGDRDQPDTIILP